MCRGGGLPDTMSMEDAKRNVMICFRTTEDLRNAMGRYAAEDRRTLSSMIESVISEHLEKHGYKTIAQEKRRRLRKPVNIPAFVSEAGSETKLRQSGVIVDISLNGLRISIPKQAVDKINFDNSATTLDVTFALPEAAQPLNIRCKPIRLVDDRESVHIGAAFVDSDFKSYQILQQYLI
jgi:hypothetical protein